MAVPALAPGLFPTALLRDASPQLATHASPAASSRMPDVVVFSSAPFRVLADLASAGLRQLATLLPILEQAITEPDPAPLGHLAKAAGAAAKQVADGHVALLAAGPDRLAAALNEAPSARLSAGDAVPQALRSFARQVGTAVPSPSPAGPNETLRAIARQIGSATEPARTLDKEVLPPAERWLAEAKHILRRTGDVLQRAAEDPSLPRTDPAQTGSAAPISWVAMEIAAAQSQVAAAAIGLERAPLPRRASAGFGAIDLPRQVASAAGVLGALLLFVLLGTASGTGFLTAFLLGVAGSVWWAWRFARAGRGLVLDARR